VTHTDALLRNAAARITPREREGEAARERERERCTRGVWEGAAGGHRRRVCRGVGKERRERGGSEDGERSRDRD
jgi:hypothetical protein